MDFPLVSVITVNYNQWEVTASLLDSIRRQSYPAVQVIVVDNGSDFDPTHVLKEQYSEVLPIRSEINLGFAGGNNLALPYAEGSLLFFLNNDTELPEHTLREMVRFIWQRPKIGMLSPMILYHPEVSGVADLVQYAGMTDVSRLTARNVTIGQGQSAKDQASAPVRTAHGHGAAMMVPMSVIDQVGPLSDDFFLYYEELDWAERIKKGGFEVWVLPSATVYHRESISVARMSGLKTYYINRNRILFMRRNKSLSAYWMFQVYWWAIVAPRNILQYAFRRDWENLRAFFMVMGWQIRPGTVNPYEQLGTRARQHAHVPISTMH
jgi:GT2 family glycosyltransferase